MPQVTAYATIAGLPPVTGLWAAVPALIAYVLSGSSKSLSIGPEATAALMTLVAIRPLAAGDPARYAELASMLALLTGLMAVAAWLLRLGFAADLLSRPVLVGYMAGVALIMIADQLQHGTGVPVTGQVFFAQVGSFARGLGHVQPTVLAVSLAVLGFLLLLRWRWPRLPGPLLAVLLASVAVAAFRPGGVGVVGPVPARLPTVQLPALHPQSLRELLLPAFTVLIVGFSDDVVTARSFARRGEEIVANRELLALGVANAGSALVRGFPVSSGTRTAIAVTVGNKTRAYSLAVAAVLVVLLFAHSLLSRIPTAALGGIVIFAAIQLIDVAAFRRLLAFHRAFDILYGMLIAIGLSVADLLVRVARPHDAVQGFVPGLAGMHDVADYPDARTIPGLLVYRYDAPLFFANAEDFRRRALAAADQPPGPLHWFVLNVEANIEVDFTALEALDSVRVEITGRGAVFALARVKQDLLARLQAFGLADKIGTELLFPTLPTAVQAFRDRDGPRKGRKAREAVTNAHDPGCRRLARSTGASARLGQLQPVQQPARQRPRSRSGPIGRAVQERMPGGHRRLARREPAPVVPGLPAPDRGHLHRVIPAAMPGLEQPRALARQLTARLFARAPAPLEHDVALAFMACL